VYCIVDCGEVPAVSLVQGCYIMIAGQLLLILLHLISCDAAITGFYYSPTPIGVDGGKTNSYEAYFKQIHTRDMDILAGMVNTIRISSLGSTTRTHDFLHIVEQRNLSVLAGFGLNPYQLNSPKKLQQQLANLRTDFKKFILAHKDHSAIHMWCIGDVEDYVFTVGTSLQQYPQVTLIISMNCEIICTDMRI
jgi:hypothetical protein